MFENPAGKAMFLENLPHRLEVKLCGHVTNRAILLVKIFCGIRTFIIALDQVPEHLPMAHQMIAQIHGHESGELHEARIDLSARAGIRSEEHTSELESLMRISSAVFCSKQK